MMLITNVNINIVGVRGMSQVSYSRNHVAIYWLIYSDERRWNQSEEGKMVLLKDVAKLAGVSMMTVSRAINNPEKLKKRHWSAFKSN